MTSDLRDVKQCPQFQICLFNGHQIDACWSDFEVALRRAFSDSEFLGGSSDLVGETTVETVLTRIRRATNESDRHLVALDKAGRILGAVFTIPAERREGQVSTGLGWTFVEPSVTGLRRVQVFDGLVAHTITLLAHLGFEEIETSIGTRTGARTLRRRYGFVHSPTPTESNRWVKEIKGLVASCAYVPVQGSGVFRTYPIGPVGGGGAGSRSL